VFTKARNQNLFLANPVSSTSSLTISPRSILTILNRILERQATSMSLKQSVSSFVILTKTLWMLPFAYQIVLKYQIRDVI
jgi:hypothetical protein